MKTNEGFKKKIIGTNQWPIIKPTGPGIAVERAIACLNAYCNALLKKFTNDLLQRPEGAPGLQEIRSDYLVARRRQTDAEITENVIELLKSYSSLNYAEIKVNVNECFVTLTGVVKWDFVQGPLINSIGQLEGVTGVSLRMIAFK